MFKWIHASMVPPPDMMSHRIPNLIVGRSLSWGGNSCRAVYRCVYMRGRIKPESVRLIDMYRIDTLGTASTCTSVGTASIYSQIHLVADMGSGALLRYKEGRKGEE
jgi:hypothetical protein